MWCSQGNGIQTRDRLRVVSNFGDSDSGASKIHVRIKS